MQIAPFSVSAETWVYAPPLSGGVPHEIVTGRDEILRLRSLLVRLCEVCGQQGAMEHLSYFLSFPTARKKTPHLLLLGATREQAMKAPDRLLGAVLLFEYRIFGLGTRIFATEDTAGRRTVIAPARLRGMVAALAAETLMRLGAEIVLETFAEIGLRPQPVLPSPPQRESRHWRKAMRVREIPAYLPLERTIDATMAAMGQRSRRNLRYYRRRAETQLGARFVPEVSIARSDLQAFNRRCAFAVPEDVVDWRFDALACASGMVLSGVQDGHGGWLSMIAGRRSHHVVEIDWQMNRADLPESSLGTVMRAFFMEHEIAQGTRRLYLEGGTPHSMRFSFATETVCDLMVLRRPILLRLRSLVRSLHRRLARFVPLTNFVLQMLSEPKLEWRRWS